MSGRGKGGMGLGKKHKEPRTRDEFIGRYGEERGARKYEKEWGEWDRAGAQIELEQHIANSATGVEKVGHSADITNADSDDEPITNLVKAAPKRKRADSEDQPVLSLVQKKNVVKKASSAKYKPKKEPMRRPDINLALPKLR